MNTYVVTNKKYTKRSAGSNSSSSEVIIRKKNFHVGGLVRGPTEKMTSS
jgi:hypothetical protein